jgi:uncharacterized protein
MKPLLELLVKALVDTPAQVVIVETCESNITHFQITVADTDRGQVIGKQGRIANAIRTLTASVARKYGNPKSVKIDIL